MTRGTEAVSPSKTYRITAADIVRVAPGRGSCVASDMILIDGQPVRYMYREIPDCEHDSGWRFFSGRESQEYADDPTHFARYDVNTVANYDQSILPFLDAPPGSAFEREAEVFAPVPFPNDPDAN